MAENIFSRSKFKWVLLSALGISLLGGGVYGIYRLQKAYGTEVREWTIGLLFPAIVGVGGYLLNQQAGQRAEKEQQEHREQSELKDYLDRISTLVVENGLTKKTEESEAYQIARALTANILRELSEERMNQVMFFLRSLKLSGVSEKSDSRQNEESEVKILSLFRGIDLNGAELKDLNAAGGDFRKANLSSANLSYVDLWGANLSYVDLRGADLLGANLSYAILWGADLNEANFIEVNLSKTTLSEHLSEEQQEQCAVYDPIIVEPKE